MAEWKIGEIKQINGEWYQCIVAIQGCRECSFRAQDYCTRRSECMSIERSDEKSVIFKKLEKVGLPYYNSDNKLCQEYKCYIVPLITDDIVYVLADNRAIIEVKQNKEEDMEGKKIKLSQDDMDWLKKQIRWAALPGYITDEEDYDRATEEIMNLFISSDTEHSSSEKIRKNLKPFDLEAAKAGKPVCTRDGRKARIICFDAKGKQPIIALFEREKADEVIIQTYNDDGSYYGLEKEDNRDLMMLPEKKEGWVNVYKGIDGVTFSKYPYTSKDEAIKESDILFGRIDTIKVEWEE